MVFRKQKEEFQKSFSAKIFKALSTRPEERNESKKGLKVAPDASSNVSEWYKRSFNKAGLLPNGNVEKARILTKLQDTCTYDSYLQALTWLYIDDEHFRRTIDEHIRTSPDAVWARFIAVFAQKGATSNIRCWRTQLLSKNCCVSLGAGTKIITCGSFNLEVIQELVAPLFPTMTSTCRCHIVRKFNVIQANAKDLRGFGFKFLQPAVDKWVNNEKILCQRCGLKFRKNQVFGDIVFIWVPAHVSKLPKVKEPTEIPQTIVLKEQIYDLTCFTDLDCSKAHAKMNCRRMDKNWYHYDNNLITAGPLTHESTVETLMYKRRAANKSDANELPFR